MLILFDIDLTLIRSGGVGYTALERAGCAAFGPACSPRGIPFGGQLDPLIFALMLRAAELEPTPERFSILRDGYLAQIERDIADAPPGSIEALPGVFELLEALTQVKGVSLGLLTGNLEPSGTLKLRAAGIDAAQFPVRVWGDESPHEPPDRAHLPPVAMDRHELLSGARLAGERVVIIGDSEHDVRAARANRCRSLAVATGRTDARTLADLGADRVVADLTDTSDVVGWIMGFGEPR